MMPQDPFTYIGRVHRNAEGVVETMEVFTPLNQEIELQDGDEFVTFVTVTDLTKKP